MKHDSIIEYYVKSQIKQLKIKLLFFINTNMYKTEQNL